MTNHLPNVEIHRPQKGCSANLQSSVLRPTVLSVLGSSEGRSPFLPPSHSADLSEERRCTPLPARGKCSAMNQYLTQSWGPSNAAANPGWTGTAHQRIQATIASYFLRCLPNRLLDLCVHAVVLNNAVRHSAVEALNDAWMKLWQREPSAIAAALPFWVLYRCLDCSASASMSQPIDSIDTISLHLQSCLTSTRWHLTPKRTFRTCPGRYS